MAIDDPMQTKIRKFEAEHHEEKTTELPLL